jgi:phage portal protein BeeE
VQHLDRATFANIEHLAIEFVRDAVTPWARRLEQEADYKLLSARGPRRRTLLDLAPLTQGDFKSRADGYAVMRNIGAYSINDILHAEGRNGIGPEGDVRIVGVNMQPLERMHVPMKGQYE